MKLVIDTTSGFVQDTRPLELGKQRPAPAPQPKK